MRRLLVLVVLLALGRQAAGEPPSPPTGPVAPGAPAQPPAQPTKLVEKPITPEQAADAVLAAVKSKEDAVLKALAARDEPDPWLVADELIARGELVAADGFAKAAPRVDVEKLPAYVASRRGKPDDAARRARLAAANAALPAGRFAGALEALGPPEVGPIQDVVGLRLAMGRGIALASLVRLEESAAAFLAAGEAAERVGWLAQANRALYESGKSAFRGSVFAAALDAWARCLSVSEKRSDKAGAAGALGNIGNVYWSLGDYAKALSAYERALAAQQALGDKAGAAKVLGNIGLIYQALGEYAKALSTYERALSAKEALGDEAGAANTVGNIGNVYYELGDYAKALSTYERALAAQQALGDKAGASKTLGNIGRVYYALGDYAIALATYERAFSAKEALGDKAGAARTLCNMGNVYASLGDYAKALSTYERALAAQQALGDKAGAALTLGNIGNVYLSLGEYAKALATLERALSAQQALGDKAGAAQMLGDIGSVYWSLGDYVKALATSERALAAQQALGKRAGAATTLGGIGNVYYALGDYAKALSTYERALSAQQALGDKAGAAKTLGNIGRVYYRLGDYAKALATQERALSAREALGDRAGAAYALGSIGRVYSALGETAKAIKSLERAARAAEKLGANRVLVSSLEGLARARLRSGDAGRAIESAHRAVSLLKTLVGGLGEQQGATARGQYTGLFATGLAAAAKADDASEAAFFLESGRAGTMLESLDARDSLRHAALPEALRIAEATARAGEARALVAYTKSQDGGDPAAILAREEELHAARAKVEEVGERIQRDAKREARLWYPVASPVEDIQGFLAPGDALVLYGLAEKDEAAHALVLTHEGARIVRLGMSSEVVAACKALRAYDVSSDVGGARGVRLDERPGAGAPAPALERLRDLVVTPLGLPKETKRLLVSPEGPLSYVPFAALVPEWVVAYEASGSTYGVLLEEKGKHGGQVLALGDADYTAKFDPTSLDVYAREAVAVGAQTRGGRFAQLPGAREEALAVADVRLFGKDASETGLREALAKSKERWHSVHFACHGLVNPDRPALSSLVLTPDAENDGFLTTLEVLKLVIPSDLVVLSACETGKDKIAGGEGIVGLARAFMYAGAPRVICSLWKVDDEATKALMVKFYELWNPKDGSKPMGTAAALKAAQEHVKSQEKWKHPYYWAAWVLWGLPD